MHDPVVVVGAGAAGCMAAIFAAMQGARVRLLERTRDGGRKILISGGGRCNVLPSELSAARYTTASSANTLRKMLLSWPLAEQRTFFEERLGLRLVLEPETGKLFPASNRARDVRDGLIRYAQDLGVETVFDTQVTALSRPGSDAPWAVETRSGGTHPASAVVLATGGLSVPATGSDGTGLRIAEKFGHTIHALYPALTPLTCEPAVHASLAGVSLPVTIRAPQARGEHSAHGGFLFTHRGYSGPAVLDISHHAVRSRLEAGARQPLRVRWTAHDAAAWDEMLRAEGGGSVGALLRRHLPGRLAETLAGEADVPVERPIAQLRREERRRLVQALVDYPLPWTGDEGYKKAEVTGGGVALGEVNPRTLESRLHAGLYLCGEMLDAFGPIGGYNFCWAWATGRLAGLGAAAGFLSVQG
jgi:predicted Rossmann fold flavoprotein